MLSSIKLNIEKVVTAMYSHWHLYSQAVLMLCKKGQDVVSLGSCTTDQTRDFSSMNLQFICIRIWTNAAQHSSYSPN